MTSITLQNNKILSQRSSVYIVAELNTSHFGNLDVAFQMIDGVREAGADCVKFQSWSDESLYSSSFYLNNPMTKRFVEKFSLSENELRTLRDYAIKSGLDFASTPYSIDEVHFLIEECEVPFIKVASMDLNNLVFLKEIAQTGIPIFLSTGMGSSDEIRSAVEAIKSCGNSKLVLLHCISLYPAPDSLLNLNNIIGLRSEFPEVLVGYSDHSLGDLACYAAVGLGSVVIEKHVTLDSKRIGFDNQMAMEFTDFKRMVYGVRQISQMLGTESRILSPLEISKSLEMRRSIVAKRDIVEGEILTLEMLDFKRPGSGIPLDKLSTVLGRKAKTAIAEDFLLEWDQIQ